MTGTVQIGCLGWQEETENGNDDDREGVYYLSIVGDPGGDNDELATIVHRVCDGKYPLDGPLAQEKERHAQVIVDALNNKGVVDRLYPPPAPDRSNVDKAIEDARWHVNLALEQFGQQPLGRHHKDSPHEILSEILRGYRTSGHWIVVTDEEYRKAFDEEVSRQREVIDERCRDIYRSLNWLVPADHKDL